MSDQSERTAALRTAADHAPPAADKGHQRAEMAP